MGKMKFVAGVVIGAVVGGAISLTDRKTREEMNTWGKHVCELVKNREQLVHSSKEIMNLAKETYEQVNEDIGFIRDKVSNLKELTPQVKELVEETKTTFLPDEEKSSAASDSSALK
ncbi:hypothetical protein [Bacillus sp. REN10]|uniref:hypothetical protein n=1 Tax=Bacillus sp. REN10 TaxID=2782541 RepID=UPI00193BFCFE|nr:hypothetical protein [Bacillus sp. REN10]